MEIDKDTFLAAVYMQLKENPEWLHETFRAANDGVLSRLDKETTLRANAEVALSMTLTEKGDTNLPPKVYMAIIESGMFKGTPYAKQYEKKLAEMLKDDK